MRSKDNTKKIVDAILTIVILILNLIVIFRLRQYVRDSTSDKTIIMYFVLYPMLLLIDVIVWLIVRKRRPFLGQNLKWIIIFLLVTFLPILITIYE